MRVRPLLLPFAAALVAVVSGCGTAGIEVAADDPLHRGAEVFNQRCGGCHTLDAAGTEGSASKIQDAENKDGPNFNQRKEQYADVVYAIQNGGFSSGPMPQNIVTGDDAKFVACFVDKYSGKDAKRPATPTAPATAQSGGSDCESSLPTR